MRMDRLPDPLMPWSPGRPGTPQVTIIIVSYNTRDLTLACLQTLLTRGGPVLAEVVVFDNASSDDSAVAIAQAFPEVRLIASGKNVGFAAANNMVAEQAHAPLLLLLNPDTEVQDRAIRHLLDFAAARPEAGIWGGRTVFPDGRLNPTSCFNRITLRSQACRSFGLDRMFPESPRLNPEAIGGWRRDDIREVDIVGGCFFLTTHVLWQKLGGFDLRYFMYGEEADFCLRAAAHGARPMITPRAQIMHLTGASASLRADRIIQVGRARATLIRRHWPPARVPFGIALLLIWAGLRLALAGVARVVRRSERAVQRHATWRRVWQARRIWIAGYGGTP